MQMKVEWLYSIPERSGIEMQYRDDGKGRLAETASSEDSGHRTHCQSLPHQLLDRRKTGQCC